MAQSRNKDHSSQQQSSVSARPNMMPSLSMSRIMSVLWIWFLEAFWKTITHTIGLRFLATQLQQSRWLTGGAYQNTVFFFDHERITTSTTRRLIGGNSKDEGEKDKINDPIDDDMVHVNYIALTIDDGFCRPTTTRNNGDNDDNSLLDELLQLLHQHDDAKATFFVCTDYSVTEATSAPVLRAGHELGNHLSRDAPAGYFARLPPNEFRTELQRTNDILRSNVGASWDKGDDGSKTDDNENNAAKPRWFRPPQGIMTQQMRQVVEDEEGMMTALGDVYCDDWAFAQYEDGVDGNVIRNNNKDSKKDSSNNKMKHVVTPIMLQQVQPGSVVIFHMPQRGFREGSLDGLRAFLEGLQEKKGRDGEITKEKAVWKCVTLSQLYDLTHNSTTNNRAQT